MVLPRQDKSNSLQRSIRFLFDSLKSAVLKVFQKLLNMNKIFLLQFRVYFLLLLKQDFLNEPEHLVKRTSEGKQALNELTALEALLILARTTEKCAVKTQALLKSVSQQQNSFLFQWSQDFTLCFYFLFSNHSLED